MNFAEIGSPQEVVSGACPKYLPLLESADFDILEQRMEYEGTLCEVLDDLSTELASGNGDVYKRLLHPPRIIRAILDDTEPSPYKTTLVSQAVDLAQKVYTQTADIWDVDLMTHLLSEADREPLLDQIINQQMDSITCEGMDPIRLAGAARLLSLVAPQEDILFLPLAHGGVAAGLDVFLRYKTKNEENSLLYPVRFSRIKKDDKLPKLTDDEKELLITESERREIIIFDEDISSGKTLQQALDFFKSDLFPNRRVTTLTAYNTSHVPEINPVK